MSVKPAATKSLKKKKVKSIKEAKSENDPENMLKKVIRGKQSLVHRIGDLITPSKLTRLTRISGSTPIFSLVLYFSPKNKNIPS